MLLASLLLALAWSLNQPSTDLGPISPSYLGPKTALILTAHPDDEVMFFTPTILALQTEGWEVQALCLSNGRSPHRIVSEPLEGLIVRQR